MQPTIPLRQDNHPTTLRVENDQVGEDLPHGVCRNSPISVSTCSSCHVEGLSLLLCRRPMVRSSENLERRWSLSLKLSHFSVFLFLWITLNRILKRRKLPPSFLHTTCPFLDFFSSFSLFLFIFRSLHFSIILHLSLLLFSLAHLFLIISLRHINLLTIDP